MTSKIDKPEGRDIDKPEGRSLDDLKQVIASLLETDGRTEAEVKAFQKKAAKMMHNLGLTEEEVRAKDPDMFQADVQITRFDWIVSQFIMNPIEELTGTKCWYNIMPTPSGKRSDRKLVHFAGYRSDVDQAIWMFSHILEQAKASARGISATNERNSYLVGFGAAVNSKIRDLVSLLAEVRDEACQMQPGMGTELMLLEKAQVVAAFLKTIAPNLVSDNAKGTQAKNRAAAQAGARDGKSVTLGRGVSQGAKAITSIHE
ncbi:MAG: hypothetical protein GOVbin4933_30 [Prokaryotic dsDNA virus sp.]|nr:MAG: hypothetical protein GOVbin4933_30 [Prokaryotic dsDNA virus sp.]|tara:strand:+ start:745 stop:1521 length:777 start_codon:yes stop_codon:yes gene_type:complete